MPRTLTDLKALGVKLAIDDFGTGYSSIGHLGHLVPVDILKIDRSFVRGLFSGDENAATITAIVELAQKLGLTIVAEGIEEIAQTERLRQMSCAVGQGFVLGHPLPAALVTEGSSSSASINPRPPPDKPAPGGSSR